MTASPRSGLSSRTSSPHWRGWLNLEGAAGRVPIAVLMPANAKLTLPTFDDEDDEFSSK